MEEQVKNKGRGRFILDWIIDVYQKTIYIFAFLFLMVLSLLSVFFTAYMPMDTVELTVYQTHTVGFVVFLFLFVIGLVFYIKMIKKIEEKKVFYITMGVSFLISLMLVFVLAPKLRYDPALLSKYAEEILNQNYSSLGVSGYLSRYHFLLGLESFIIFLTSLFGSASIYIFRIMNCIGIVAIVYAMHNICELLFTKKNILYIFDLLMCLCLPLFYFSTFFYGNIFSISLGMLAVMYQLRLLKGQYQLKSLILCIVCIVLSVIAKGNSIVVLIAIVLQFLFHKDIDNRYRWAGIILPVVCYLGLTAAITATYENISGQSLTHELPKTAHIAMGLQESNKAPGWYNGFPYRTHKLTNYDTALTSEKSVESIRQSIDGFVKDPKYGVTFFTKKTVSQWNNPTFQSLWIQYKYKENFIAKALLKEDSLLYKAQIIMLDVYELAIYAGAFFCLWLYRKKINAEFLELALIFVGGFVFQLFWEAKGMHALPYFLVIIPYAAAGLEGMREKMVQSYHHHFQKSR